MHVSVSGLCIPIFALSAFSLVCRAGLQCKPVLCAQRGDANLVCSLAVAMMFRMGSSCTTRVSMSPMSFVPVAGRVDDQQRCSASSVVSSCAFPSLKDDGLGPNLLIPPCPLQLSCPETFRFSFAPRSVVRSVVRRVRVVFRCVLCLKSFSPHHRSLSRVVEEQLLMRGFDYAEKKKRCALWSSVMADSASRT